MTALIVLGCIVGYFVFGALVTGVLFAFSPDVSDGVRDEQCFKGTLVVIWPLVLFAAILFGSACLVGLTVDLITTITLKIVGKVKTSITNLKAKKLPKPETVPPEWTSPK